MALRISLLAILTTKSILTSDCEKGRSDQPPALAGSDAAILDAAASSLFNTQRFLVAAAIAFLPTALNFLLGFEGSGGCFDVGFGCFTGALFGVLDDACCELTTSFA